MEEYPWHDVLYAYWCLEDLERVDGIEARQQRVLDNSLLPITDGGARNLEQERQAVNREIRTPFGRASTGMTLEELSQFPGMPGYSNKPVS